jgi:hypothetical protein
MLGRSLEDTPIAGVPRLRVHDSATEDRGSEGVSAA